MSKYANFYNSDKSPIVTGWAEYGTVEEMTNITSLIITKWYAEYLEKKKSERIKMKENTTAKALKGIGIAIMALSFIGALIVGSETTNELIPITFIVSGVVSGTMFIGFGEIINLLQKNVNKQDDLLRYLKDNSSKENNAPKTVLQDIEDNLPNM